MNFLGTSHNLNKLSSLNKLSQYLREIPVSMATNYVLVKLVYITGSWQNSFRRTKSRAVKIKPINSVYGLM